MNFAIQRRSPLPLSYLVFLAGPALAQSNWVDFTEMTGTRLVGDPLLTTNDPVEKDMVGADLDLDGDIDVIIARKVAFDTAGGEPNVLLMNENGVLVDRSAALAPTFLIADNSRDVETFDANGDGWPDIVVANTLYEYPRLWINQGVDGSGVFQGFVESMSWIGPAFPDDPKFCSVSAGDVDGDGDEDLFFGDYRQALEDRLLINDGTGFFTDETTTRMTPATAVSEFIAGSAIVDMNGDGWKDIVKIENGPFDSSILWNDGSGNFHTLQAIPNPAAYEAEVGDFDNDGRFDLYIVDDLVDFIWFNDATNPDGSIQMTAVNVAVSGPTDSYGGNPSAADMDRDGYLDMATSDVDQSIIDCSRNLGLLRNEFARTGRGMTDPNDPTLEAWNVGGSYDTVWLDLNGDGFQDFIAGTCTGLRVFEMVPFALPGSSYCVSTFNSSGTEARIHAVGSTSVQANDYTLVVEGARPKGIGLFFYGNTQVQLPFGDGVRCVGGGTTRLAPAMSVGASNGMASRAIDFTAAPANGGAGAILPGQSRTFQFWYRDPALPGGLGFNLSDGWATTFTP